MPKFEREVEIDAPVEKVWETITEPELWPQWFPGVESVSSATPIREGGTFEWKDEDRTGEGRIVKMEPMKRLEIMTQMGDDKDSHIFQLRPSGSFLGLGDDECKVKYTLDTLMGGGILGKFIAGGNPKDALRVKKAMHLLRKLAERI
jgi:uncharacterized protein YndB with AHSA1/START domain